MKLHAVLIALTASLLVGFSTTQTQVGPTDLGDQGIVMLSGYDGADPLTEARIDFDFDGGRVYRLERRSIQFTPDVFDGKPRHAFSMVQLTGVTSFRIPWAPVKVDLTGILPDWRLDYTGQSGRTIRVRQLLSQSVAITDPEVLSLFEADPVVINWQYFGSTSIEGFGAYAAQVDECMEQGLITVTYNP